MADADLASNAEQPAATRVHLGAGPPGPGRTVGSRRSTWLAPPAPHLGGVTVIAAPGWSSMVIEAMTKESVAHVEGTRPDVAVVRVEFGSGLSSPERTRRIVAAYRWVLGQRVEPTTIKMVVEEDQVSALTAALAHSGDPHPGGIVLATGPGPATNRGLRRRIA